MLTMLYVAGGRSGQYFVADSNKFLAIAIATTSFLWFKNLNIKYSKLINTIGASTFGVLLIHANSNAMRQWLWKDTIDCIGHHSMSIGNLIIYSVCSILAIFTICTIIDVIRIKIIETPFFDWLDRKINLEELWKKKILSQ